MTCIVGLEHPGGVLIGGDSAAGHADFVIERADRKVFAAGPYAIGFTTSYRMGQLLRYRFDPPIPTADDLDDLDRFMATTFVDGVRQVFADGGFMKVSDSQEEGGEFLVGIAGRLYDIGGGFEIGRNACGYSAVGSGSSVAFGSLHTTGALEIAPKLRVEYALNAATDFSPLVTPPFVIFNAPGELDL